MQGTLDPMLLRKAVRSGSRALIERLLTRLEPASLALLITDLPPGELFVHRNIANLIVQNDLNCLSVMQYAVEVLKVKHIVVCGHYGCGGVKAAMDNRKHGLIDDWLRHIQDVIHKNPDKMSALQPEDKFNLLCELNVHEQVKNVSNTTIVRDAWKKGADLSVHGWIYDLKTGILKDLKQTVTGV